MEKERSALRRKACGSMFLKSIRAQGFKSFADKITLDFSTGVTAVVGPNGSGKSNISDAVRWVLGEQSAKSLRGSNMQDVIFSGTQKRPALGFAMVELTLDNQDQTYNVPYEELTVTRKVYRSGESEYLINGAACRLKDIHEIFMDTGLGKDGYSMIGQGRVEEILSNKSEDRRQIFEEASGISKYRYRKEEAQRKLSATEDNLCRILDIIAELENQLGPLEKQAEKAKQYLKLRDELRHYEVNVALRVIDINRAELSGIQEKFSIVSEQLTRTKQEMERAEQEQEKLYQASSEKERFARESEKKYHDAEAAATRLKGEIEVLHNTIAGNNTLVERVNSEVAELKQRMEDVRREIEETQALLQSHRERAEAIGGEIAELEQQAEAFDVNAGQQNSEIEGLKQQVVAKMGEISELKIRLSNFELIKNNHNTRRSAIADELASREEARDKLSQEFAEAQSTQARKTEFVARLSQTLADKRQQAAALTASLEKQRQELTAVTIEWNDNKSRYSILSAMEQSYEGYYKSVKSVMKESQNGCLKGARIHGPLSKLISADSKYITAVETALGAGMQNIVVDDEQDAKAAIAYLKQAHAGRATFLPLSAMRGSVMSDAQVRGDDGYIGIASELVEYDVKYQGAVRQLLGRTVVADTVDNGIRMSKKHKNSFRIVTLTGEVFNVGGSMAGGSINKQASLLGREAEIAELKKKIARLERTRTTLADRLAEQEKQRETLSRELEGDAAVLQENQEILVKIEHDIQYAQTRLDDANAQMDALRFEDAELIEKCAQCDAEAETVAAAIQETEAGTDDIRAKINELEQDFERVMVQRQRMQDKIVDKTVEKNAVLKDIEICGEKLEALRQDNMQNADHLELRTVEIQDIGEKNRQLTEDIETKTKQIEQNRRMAKELQERVGNILAEKQQTEEQSRGLQDKARELREVVYDLQQEYARIEGKKVKLETDQENAINRLWEEYELTYTTAQELRADIGPVSEASKRITALRGEIRALGNVNVDAIEEFKAVSERFQFLTTQRDDLVQAKENLLKLIDEMMDIMRGRFSAQFAIIARHFKTTFVELFGGGRAELKLTDPGNVLESGIDIDVQPPGKKLQSLSLLSGGERALSAIALLFAILKTRPTPFCFLDEIEAALDDVNVYRFADYVKNYSDNTQFIIVTHRRGTMEAADVIYGVTMQEKGVSKLLKLNVDEAMAAAK